MKNMKVSRKLIVSFVFVIVLSVVVGCVGIIGMSELNAAQDEMYIYQTESLTYLSNLTTIMQRLRVNNREYEIGIIKEDTNQINSAYNLTKDLQAEITDNFDAFEKTIRVQEVRDLFNEARSIYDNTYKVFLEESYQLAIAGDFEAVDAILYASGAGSAKEAIDTIVANLDACLANKVQQAADANNEGQALYTMLLTTIIIVLVGAAAASLVLALYISGLISKPLVPLTAFLQRAGSTGNLKLSPQDVKIIEDYGNRKDEIGQTINAAGSFVARITDVSEALETISSGDLTKELDTLSEQDTLGLSLQKMTNNLNMMFSEVNTSTSQVSTGASQVADGAQALAQGATEQAATIEELSSSIAEIAGRTKENAAKAEQAAKLAATIKGSAEKGSQQMYEMMAAVKDINQSSHDISRIIKVIDDIAFQTNILALNASVEAARAGQHGKGFAVVAEEVRNLAAKSAEAASDTENLIADSLTKAELGVNIANQTSASLVEIVSGITESNSHVAEIAASSEEQFIAISQINTAIDQVAQVVQQNSATAEESAAASEEMSSQSAILLQLVAQFKIKGQEDNSTPMLPSGGNSIRSAREPAYNNSYGDSFGKY